MKVAYICEPQIGGTFSFFLELRKSLLPRGIDFRCVPPCDGSRFEKSSFAGLDGIDYLHIPESDLAESTKKILRHLTGNQFRIVMILPGCEVLSTNMVRYLPNDIRTIGRVPMATHGMYRAVRAIGDYLDHIVGVCQRIADDLQRLFKFDERRLSVIENGVEIRTEDAGGNLRTVGRPLRILYVGRLEEVQKNILLLPAIAQRLDATNRSVAFTIVGDGPDRERLRRAFQRKAPNLPVEFLGGVTRAQLFAIYRRHDIFVLPSRFEGTPNALLEAMESGCVPVVTRIRGSTDAIIQDGANGFLARMGDPADFARAILLASSNERQYRALSKAASATIRERFSIDRMAQRYESLMRKIVSDKQRGSDPRDIENFDVLPALRYNWRQWIPPFIKKTIRTTMGRLGRTI